jgi:phosphoribosylglycinamide formyltransferase-1
LTPAPQRARLPAVILISGRGSNMQVILEQALAGLLALDVRAVISDRAQAPGLATARTLGFSTQLVASAPGSARAEYDAELAQAVRAHAPQVVALAGFMRILSRGFVEEFVGRMLNIHPSLLPEFRGLDTHARVLEARERQHGASVHFVTPELDAGPVVIQGRLEVHPDDTEDRLAARVLRIEHQIYPRALGWLADGRLEWNGGNIRLDGQALSAPKIIEERDL